MVMLAIKTPLRSIAEKGVSTECAKEDQYQESIMAAIRAAKASESWENRVRDLQGTHFQRKHNGNCFYRGEL